MIYLTSCGLIDDRHEIEPCEFELFRDAHYLELPLAFVPYQEVYKVGDTVTVDMIFQDSIYDQGTRQTFKVKDFIFRPSSGLYRMWKEGDNFAWDSGFRVNELLVDTLKYSDFHYTFFGSTADQIIAGIPYDMASGTYEYSYKVVLKEPGRYFFFTSDYSIGTWSSDPDYHDMIESIEWEGKCQLDVGVYCTLEHPGHYEDYIDELQYLNTEVRIGGIHSLDRDLGLETTVSFAIENNGGFCFEVIE